MRAGTRATGESPEVEGHRIFHAQVGENMGVIQQRAFCSCEWVSEPTWHEERYREMIDAHLHGAGGTANAVE